MNNRERLFIYSTLLVLLTINLSVLLGGMEHSAGATPAPSRAQEDQLGPADSIALNGEKELVLRNKSGHVAWNEADAHSTAYSIGFMHVGKALSQLMESEQYADERKRLADEIESKDQDFDNRAHAFLEENKDIKPDSPNFDEVRKQFEQLQDERRQWEQEKRERRGKLTAGQIEKAYRDITSAVEVVSDRHHIDIVYRFIPTADPFEAANPEQASQAVLARIAMRYPEGLDITREVLEEMSLKTD